ncbi:MULTISPECIES: transcriptional repressor [unclassified Brevundimonas]|uniref:transcriptional repressor n=1 Tax=unclassified Brevundimonas TaxID=2622653 RepID=UPI001304E811|nr:MULTISPECIES: transcriptional repressor [unclassified Brevundimonas]
MVLAQDSSGYAVEQVLKAHGLLLNRARRDVLHVLLHAEAPLDVDSALAAARSQGSHVSRAAVSRFLNLLNRLGVAEVAARRNARRFFRLKRRTPTLSLSCVRQNRIIEVRDDALVQAVEQMLHGHGYRLAEGIHFRIEPLPLALACPSIDPACSDPRHPVTATNRRVQKREHCK